MKKSNKLLSLILTLCIAMSMLTGFAPVHSVAHTAAIGSEAFELPDIVDSFEAQENDYVGRVKAEEKEDVGLELKDFEVMRKMQLSVNPEYLYVTVALEKEIDYSIFVKWIIKITYNYMRS